MRLFDADTKSVNENAIVNLPAGTNVFTIKRAWLHTAKSTNENMIAVSFTGPDGGTYSHYFRIAAANADARRIGAAGMKGLWDACKLQGTPDIEMLPNFAGKRVEMSVTHTTPDDQGRFFANIQTILPADRGPAPVVADPDDDLPMGNESPAPSEEPAADAPAPKRVFKLKSKTATPA